MKEKKSKEDMIKPEKKVEQKEAKIKSTSSDVKIILGIVGGMILTCVLLIIYYFYGVNNQVIATYGKDGKVTRGEYTTYYKLFAPMLTYYGYEEDKIKDEVLNKIVIDEIVLAKAKKEKVKISDEDQEEIDEIFEDEDQIEQYAEQGIDESTMREIYENDALITTYINKITDEATEETIKAFIDENEGENANYNKYVTSYILYSTTSEDADKDEIKENAQATLARIKNGEGFDTVGEEVQEADSTNIQYGSEYSVYLNGTSVEAYEEAVRKLAAGEMTQELVKSKEYGYFIIKVNSIEANARINGEDAAENYSNELLAKWQSDAKIKAKDKRLNRLVKSLASSTTSES